MEKKLKAFCPHCNRPILIDLSDANLESSSDGWLVCTPLQLDDSDLKSEPTSRDSV
jgi:hypothetical protein